MLGRSRTVARAVRAGSQLFRDWSFSQDQQVTAAMAARRR